MLQNLVLKITYLHYYVVLEQIIVLLVDLGPSLVYAPLLPIKLEILALSWSISSAPAHLIFTPTWEKYVILD
jgi:hypothetical protein